MASERGPPKGGGDSALVPNQQSGQSDSWVLAAIDSWIRSGRPREDIVGKVMTSFGLVDLRAAAYCLYNGKWCQPNISVPNTTRQDYSRKLAETVYDGLLYIQNQNLKVNFWVSSEDIAKLPGVGPFPDTLDEPEVSARLLSMDNQLLQMMEKLKSTEKLEGMVEALAKTVTELKEQLKESREGQGPAVQSTQQSWAEITGGQQRLGRLQTLQVGTGQRAGRSVSRKRSRDRDDDERQSDLRRRRLVQEELQQSREVRAQHPALPGSALSQGLRRIALGQNGDENGFQEVHRRKRVTQKGCSTVEAEGGTKPPCSVFISGTSTNTTEETVKEKLMQCAQAIREAGEEKELQIVGVQHIKLNIPADETPRSKCWKVTVSPEWAAHMMKGEAYPAAWGWRKWNQGPRRVQDQQGSQPLGGGA